MEEKEFKKGEIIIYKTAQGPKIDARLEKDNIWLNQNQIAALFGTKIPAIAKHAKNIYKTSELKKSSTISKMEIVQKEGKREIRRRIDFYNLDMIIAVGYRVSSKKATQFRIWATKTLKNHLIKGYTINEKGLLDAKEKLVELQGAISFLRDKAKNELLSGQGQEILNILSNYSKTLTILEQYDKDQLKMVGTGKADFVLEYEEIKIIIEALKKELIDKKEASGLFGQEYESRFEGIVKNLYQTFDSKELYKTIGEKAANLLYLTIKDHPFVDGNKRIASFLFVYFLDKNGYLYKEDGERKINDNALVALALLIAVSDPKEKDVMIKIITNLIS